MGFAKILASSISRLDRHLRGPRLRGGLGHAHGPGPAAVPPRRLNPRNGEQPDVYFDEELYKNRFKIEQTNG